MAVATDRIDLEVVTPERLVLSETVDEVVLPGSEGYLGVLPGHAPLLAALQSGELSYRTGERVRYLAVDGGYAEVLRHRVRVLAETCERAEEIDLERAERAKAGAEGVLVDPKSSEADHRRAEARLRRAVVRIQVHRHGRI